MYFHFPCWLLQLIFIPGISLWNLHLLSFPVYPVLLLVYAKETATIWICIWKLL